MAKAAVDAIVARFPEAVVSSHALHGDDTVVIAPTDEVTLDCLTTEVRDPDHGRNMIASSEGASAETDISRGVNFYEEVRRFETDLLRRALDQTGGHQSRAARLLGLNATTLNSKIKTYNIIPKSQ